MTERSLSPLLWLATAGLLSFVTVTLPAGCGKAPNVGAACTASGGCDQGLTCDTQIDGGYCTKACNTPGSTSECPDESLCASISGAPGTECGKVCTVQSDCRPDLECNGITGSSIKVCKPK